MYVEHGYFPFLFLIAVIQGSTSFSNWLAFPCIVQMNDITTISFILKMPRPFPFHITIVFLTALVWAVDVSFSPYLIKIIIDRASTSAADNLFYNIATPAIFYVLILLLLECITRLYNYFFEIKMITNLQKTLLNQVFLYY